MKELNGTTYDNESSSTAKMLCMAGVKEGKTVFLVGSLLGVWPGQKLGGVVSDPANLHIISIDTIAMRGCINFLIKHCGASEDIRKVRIYNMEEDAKKAYATSSEWDYDFYNTLLDTYRRVRDRAATGGVHATLTSSLTAVGQALKRSLAGKPGAGDKKGSGMDMAKWDALGSQLAEIRNVAQLDATHCVWEAHLDKKTEGTGNNEVTKDTLALQGSTGKSFAMNVGLPFRLRKMPGQKYKSHPTVDQVFIDTQPSLTFLSQGRGFSELAPKEWDLTSALTKLGYKCGGWGAARSTAAKKSSTVSSTVRTTQTQYIEE